MADIQGWKEFMAQIAPMLYRQKMQKGQMETWLQNALQQYAAREASERRLGKERFGQDKIMEIIKAGAGGTEGKPRPEQLLALVLKEMGIDMPGITDITRESYGKAIGPEVDAAKKMAISRVTGDYPPEEALEQIAGVLGEESFADFLDDFFKEQGREEGLTFDREKLAATLSGQDLEKGRQKIETRKLDIREKEGGDKEKKGKDLLATYEKKEKTLTDKIGDASGDKLKALTAQREDVREKIDKIINKKIEKLEGETQGEWTALYEKFKEVVAILEGKGKDSAEARKLALAYPEFAPLKELF